MQWLPTAAVALAAALAWYRCYKLQVSITELKLDIERYNDMQKHTEEEINRLNNELAFSENENTRLKEEVDKLADPKLSGTALKSLLGKLRKPAKS